MTDAKHPHRSSEAPAPERGDLVADLARQAARLAELVAEFRRRQREPAAQRQPSGDGC